MPTSSTALSTESTASGASSTRVSTIGASDTGVSATIIGGAMGSALILIVLLLVVVFIIAAVVVRRKKAAVQSFHLEVLARWVNAGLVMCKWHVSHLQRIACHTNCDARIASRQQQSTLVVSLLSCLGRWKCSSSCRWKGLHFPWMTNDTCPSS